MKVDDHEYALLNSTLKTRMVLNQNKSKLFQDMEYTKYDKKFSLRK